MRHTYHVRIEILIILLLFSCGTALEKTTLTGQDNTSPYLIVLGIAQDAGYPQAGCYQDHCLRAWNDPSLKRKAVSLALIDPEAGKKWLFEATPDIREQLFELEKLAPDSLYQLDGVFLTHAHMGHYTGLMHFGKEVMNTSGLNVYAMPRMIEYISSHGPWSQLVQIGNIEFQPLSDSIAINLTDNLSVMPFTVPHRDEYSETAGYHIKGQGKSAVFIPDIDKWHLWKVDLAAIHPSWDYALIDATFYQDGELPGRDMSKIQHPMVTESFKYFASVPQNKKSGIHFIHFNHSNPLLIDGSPAQEEVKRNGFNYAREMQILPLR